MKKNPKNRYNSANDMLKALNNFLGWKGQATIEECLKDLVFKIESSKDVTTVVKTKSKKTRQKNLEKY